jgi:hypothetical protein
MSGFWSSCYIFVIKKVLRNICLIIIYLYMSTKLGFEYLRTIAMLFNGLEFVSLFNCVVVFVLTTWVFCVLNILPLIL